MSQRTMSIANAATRQQQTLPIRSFNRPHGSSSNSKNGGPCPCSRSSTSGSMRRLCIRNFQALPLINPSQGAVFRANAFTLSSSSLLPHQTSSRTSWPSVSQQQKRHYLFLPTSWKELELRWLRDWHETRIVNVHVRVPAPAPAPPIHAELATKAPLAQAEVGPTQTTKDSARTSARAYKNNIDSPTAPIRFHHSQSLSPFQTTDAASSTWRRKQDSYSSSTSSPASVWWHTKKLNGKLRYKAAQLRWKTRSTAVRTRMIRNSRLYADRMQRVWSRSRLWMVSRAKLAVDSSPKYRLPNPTTNTITHTAESIDGRTLVVKQPVTLTEYSESSWFCPSTGRPLTSRDATGRFVNPWLSESTAGVKSIREVFLWRWERLQRTAFECLPFFLRRFLSDTTSAPLDSSQRPPWMQMQNECMAPSAVRSQYSETAVPLSSDKLRVTWIGHATCLMQQGGSVSGVNILTDPIFSPRCSPFQSLPIGVARDVPPALNIDDLPERIDVCLISHDHYDHLDKDSVVALLSRVQLWVVPLGIKAWLMEKCNVPEQSIIELEWWESVKLRRQSESDSWQIAVRHSAAVHIGSGACTHHPALEDVDFDLPATPRSTSDENSNTSSNAMWLTCCPVQHWASRSFFDRNFRLWCSFTVFLPGAKFYFGGDTALPEHFPLFDQIRDYVGGNIDLAAIPIGAYEPSFYMADSHVNPSEAVRIHQLLDVKQSVAIHWGTFALSEENMDDPPKRLQQAARVANANFIAVQHGQSITMPCKTSRKAS